jgi:hypothetical protein
LQDIECAGGIASNFSLKAICDSKQDIYGKPNSSEQHMVWNTVNKWKHHWTRADYYALLASLGIQPATRSYSSARCTWGIQSGFKSSAFSRVLANNDRRLFQTLFWFLVSYE